MTTPDLQALIELSEKATPGEFRVVGSSVYALKHHSWKRGVEQFENATYAAFMGDSARSDAVFIAALVNWFRSTRAATVPQGVSEVRVLDRGFTFSKGVNVPTILVGFAPEDWVSRDAYAAAIDAAMTPPPAELGEGS